jgi:hypothetical protein
MSRTFKQGLYIPKHPDKYVGNINAIRYMSSWELHFHKFLDNNPNILQWSSESIKIPYVKPTTGRVHIYFPDYWLKYVTKHGELLEEIIEVKPEKQVHQPTNYGSRKTQVYNQLAFAINTAKWKAAGLYCQKKGIKFRIITEKHLFK